MAFELPFATLIGYSSKGSFFGDDVARWRTVQTVTIEGYMDPTKVDQMCADATGKHDNGPQGANDYLWKADKDVSVNGLSIKNSKLISIEFPASEDHKENHDGMAHYIATYEVYLGVEEENETHGKFFGVEFNDIKALEEYSESLTFDLSEDNTYTATIEMSVTYDERMSSATGGSGTGIAAAKKLRDAIWGQQDDIEGGPYSIPTSMGGNGINIWYHNRQAGVDTDISHWYQTEVIDLKNNRCNFSATKKILSTDQETGLVRYTSKINNSFSIGVVSSVIVNASVVAPPNPILTPDISPEVEYILAETLYVLPTINVVILSTAS